MNSAGGIWIEIKPTLASSLTPRSFRKVFLYVDYYFNSQQQKIKIGNGQVEVTWQTLLTITYLIMVHAQVLDEYIHFALIYRTEHTYFVLTMKHLVNQDGEPTTPDKLATGTKPSISNLRVLFCTCFVSKATSHIDTNAPDMHH